VLSNPWARFVILAVFIEASVGWGAFAYVGADLHVRFALSFGAIGLIVGTFGVGGLLYAASVSLLVNRFGQAGLAIFGGLLLGLAYLTLAIARVWWVAPIAVTAIGLGFYALHNTLQTNATQMTPQARGTAVAIFSSAIYLGQRSASRSRRSSSTGSPRCRCSQRPPSHCRHWRGGSRGGCDDTRCRTAPRRSGRNRNGDRRHQSVEP